MGRHASILLVVGSGLVLSLSLAACGDDLPGEPPDAGPDAGVAGCVPSALPGPLAEGDWDPRFTIAGFTGQDGLTPKVFDFARDADGNVLATGYFQWLGREPVAPLLRHRDGQWEPARTAWEQEVPAAGFTAVAVDTGGRLALSTYDPLPPIGGEIWVDSGSGLEIVGRFEGLVRSLTWYQGELWVAGDYSLDEGGTSWLSIWNGDTWTGPPAGDADGPVYELYVDDGNLFVAGAFTTVGGIAAQKVAAWDGAAWTAYDLVFFGLAVYAIERGPDGTLYAGGAFSDSDMPSGAGGVARWNGQAWEILGGGAANPFFAGVVSDLAVHEDDLYITGCFSHVNGPAGDPGAIEARSLARWTGTGWESLDDGSAPVGTVWFEMAACGDEGYGAIWDVTHQRLISDGTHLFVGGSFAGAAGIASQSIIGYDGERWIAQGEAGLGTAGVVSDLAVGGPGCALHAIGGVSHAGSERVPSGVMRYEQGWVPLGESLPAGLSCSDVAVNDAGDVYVGCYSLDEDAAARVLRLDGTSWVPVGEPHGLALLQDMAMDPAGRLWIVGGSEQGYVARLDGDRFTVVEDRFDGLVFRIDFAPHSADPAAPELVVGGGFTHIGADAFTRIARWDGSSWQPLGEGFSTTPMAVEYGARAIYGSTADEGAPDRIILGQWDGTRWIELATPERGLPAPMGFSTHTFTSLLEVGDDLVAVGYVWPETGGRNVFVYDGERFTSIGGGAAAIAVETVALTRDALWFGGSIAEVGPEEARLPSVGIARFAWEAGR